MSQRHVVHAIWIANAFGLFIAAMLFTFIAESGTQWPGSASSATGSASTATAEPPPPPRSRAWQCAETARLAQERAAAQGYSATAIYGPNIVGYLGQAEYEAYSAGVNAFNFELMVSSSDLDMLLQAFLNGAYVPTTGEEVPGAYDKCAEFYGP